MMEIFRISADSQQIVGVMRFLRVSQRDTGRHLTSGQEQDMGQWSAGTDEDQYGLWMKACLRVGLQVTWFKM